jgi:hypothetical protein
MCPHESVQTLTVIFAWGRFTPSHFTRKLLLVYKIFRLIPPKISLGETKRYRFVSIFMTLGLKTDKINFRT